MMRETCLQFDALLICHWQRKRLAGDTVEQILSELKSRCYIELDDLVINISIHAATLHVR